jgi:molybdate transport system substrate-binding protein
MHSKTVRFHAIMKPMRLLLRHVLSGVCLVAIACFRLSAADIHVFAAASLAESLKEIAAAYEKEAGDKPVFNFGASSLLARQIEEGAPADIFFSADEAKMNGLERKGLILKETRKSRLSNTLVIAVEKKSDLVVQSAIDLTQEKIKRLALAEPASVPAGIYAKSYLEKIGVWDRVAGKIVPTENVRGALAAVESGNVEAAIVYKTYAAISIKVKVAFEVPAREAPDISYPMAVVKESRRTEAAKEFLEHLGSEDAGKVFEKYGFIVRP